MTKEEFTDKLQKCYFGEKSAFNEITQYFETLQSKLNEKNKVIKEAIDYIKLTTYCDITGLNDYSILEFWFVREILEILERTENK